MVYSCFLGFPGGSDGEESICSAGDLGSIPGLGRSPGGGQSNPLQYSGLENPMDRGAWRAAILGVAKSQIGLRNQHNTQLFSNVLLVFTLPQRESVRSITCPLPLEPPSHLPPHPTSLGCHRAPV